MERQDQDYLRKQQEFNKKFYGCGAQYDPEFWPREMWPVHVKQMKDAGLSFVRLFEFCWCKFEPQEGVYEFGWADDFLNLLSYSGLDYILCTPGAAPPHWLTSNYPETVVVHADGQRDRCETRRHGCPDSDIFMQHCLKISQLIAERYGNREGLIGWQIDNEIGHPTCYCKLCEGAFREWLYNRYGTIDELNRCLGTAVWGRSYNDWEQIRIPLNGCPGLRHMFRKWTSDLWIAYIRRHVEILRPHTNKPISTNMMAPWHGYDHYEAAKYLDIVGMDYYPYGGAFGAYPYTDTDQDFILSYTRAIAGGKPFWMLETEVAGHARRIPQKELLEEWTFKQIAHGANLINYFRWDTPPFGEEGSGSGVVGPGTWVSPSFYEVQNTCKRVNDVATIIEPTVPERADVAVLFTYSSWWKFLEHSRYLQFGDQFVYEYPHLIRSHCHGLSENGVEYDIVGPDEDWNSYSCLIIPHCIVMDEDLTQRCCDYVKCGGNLLITAMSGIFNEDGVAHEAPYPFGKLSQLCGIQCTANGAIMTDMNPVLLDVNPPIKAIKWIDQLQVFEQNVDVILEYHHRLYKDFPAFTCRHVDKGKAFYFGAILSQNDMPALYAAILPYLGVSNKSILPSDIWLRSRIDSSGKRLRFFQNTGEDKVTLKLSDKECITINPHKTYLSDS